MLKTSTSSTNVSSPTFTSFTYSSWMSVCCSPCDTSVSHDFPAAGHV